ncbi:hypothetical protein LTR28_009680, partial [Elasticomyces elasticus]
HRLTHICASPQSNDDATLTAVECTLEPAASTARVDLCIVGADDGDAVVDLLRHWYHVHGGETAFLSARERQSHAGRSRRVASGHDMCVAACWYSSWCARI